MNDDMQRLDDLEFSSYQGFNAQLVRWRYERLSRFFRGRRCLELGSSDGQGTEYLLRSFDEVVAVDGSAVAVATLRDRHPDHPGLTCVHAFFEDLDLPDRYDTVVLAHILEHVNDPQQVLAVARRHLAPGGCLIVDVPNAHSLHRQLGVAMGLLDRCTQLNEADLSIGHQRVYEPEVFEQELLDAGLRIVERGGVFLKLLSNAQTESVFEPAQLEGMLQLGDSMPELSAEIFAVCEADPG